MVRMSMSLAGWMFLLALAGPVAADATQVSITPLGSHDGEFCSRDRALLLEDPDGTRLLYDPGRTVAGADDERLGRIDALLISHMHGDHVGNAHIAERNAGSCAQPDTPVNVLPDTNTVKIALAKNAAIIAGSEMPKFFAAKLKASGGDPKKARLVRFGGSTKLGGVTITTVPASHSNGIAGDMIGGELGSMLNTAGLTAHAGPPTGFVLTFSNGLVVYLSGDTGITAEQENTVRKHYRARLAVMNIGDTYTTGPREAAWVVNELIRPASVIASHANEAATEKGKIIGGTRTESFIKATRVPVHLPLSGRTMKFDNGGRCIDGCKRVHAK
ncbi:MAG: MBL fold metallo-hydrolase [Gammaproteobacteria bacterium]|nr:MBL fold metallo-hydrolase [Gammaproteobacteria bacterium]